MANNTKIYNSAFSAFIQGAVASWQTSTTQSNYNNLKAAATAFATKVDAGIPYSDGLTDAEAQLLFAICSGVMEMRYKTDAEAQVSTFWTSIAAVIAAIYTNSRTGLV